MTDNDSTSSAGDQPPLIQASMPGAPRNGRPSGHLRTFVLIFLNLCLGLFLADAFVSLVDDLLIVLFDFHLVTGIRGIVGTLALIAAVVAYGMIGATPVVPKRVFLPIVLFNPVFLLLAIPGFIYFYKQFQQLTLVISVFQCVLGLFILQYLHGGLSFHWPLLPETALGAGRFSFKRLLLFLMANLLVVLPCILVYLVLCAVTAVGHFSEGFVAVRPSGFTVQVRKYARADGKTILLVPMSHVGEPEFYRSLAEGFPTNSTILMEGVTDDQGLLTNRITYKKMATSLGLTPQEKQFKPNPVQVVMADIDVGQFTTNTIGFLNVVMLFHSRGPSVMSFLKLIESPQPPGFEKELFDDLLRKRNRHLLQEIQQHLSETDDLIIPWGAAHMPEIAREIQKSGFHPVTSREYVAIRFGKH